MAAPRTAGFVAVRVLWGGLLVTVPGPLFGVVTGRPADRADRRLLRVLGARHIVQGAVAAAHPTRTMLALGGAVDALHAASCGAAALLLPEWRRPALLDGTYATALSGYGLVCARAARP